MNADHRFLVRAEWTGDRGSGTSGWRDYARDVTVQAQGAPDILGSSARAFHGDPHRWNPEQLLTAALVQCHLLSYLHSAAARGVVVVGYRDEATAVLRQEGAGGRIIEVVLRPEVSIAAGDARLAHDLHDEAAANCFIAASVAFPVRVEPLIQVR